MDDLRIKQAMDDLRDAYPRWSDEVLERYRSYYEKLHAERGGVPFDEHAQDERDRRQSLRDQGVPVDDPPHPESHLIKEYDPPLPKCPNDCYMAEFWHMDAPNDPEQQEKWRQDGYPGRRQCTSCLRVFEAPIVPGGRRRFSRVRLETFEEVLKRQGEEIWSQLLRDEQSQRED